MKASSDPSGSTLAWSMPNTSFRGALGPLALRAVTWATNTLPSDSRDGVPEMRPVAVFSVRPSGNPPLHRAQDVAAGEPEARASWTEWNRPRVRARMLVVGERIGAGMPREGGVSTLRWYAKHAGWRNLLTCLRGIHLMGPR